MNRPRHFTGRPLHPNAVNFGCRVALTERSSSDAVPSAAAVVEQRAAALYLPRRATRPGRGGGLAPGAILNSVFGPCERDLTEDALRSNGRRVPPGGRSLSRRVVLLSTVAMLFAGQCITGGAKEVSMSNVTPPATSLPQIALQAPLVSLDTARSALGLTTEQVLNLIDDGRLSWAFNLARNPAASRASVRVLAKSLEDLQQGRETVDAEDFRAVFLLIFPQVPPRAGIVGTMRATLVARQLSLKTCVLMRLVDAGFMGLAPNTARHSGPNGSPLVVLTSVAEFLEERRIL